MEIIKRFQPGEVIFQQDEVGNSMFVIREGQVEIVRQSAQGEAFLAIQNPGEAVGLLSFFQAGKRLACARARTEVEGLLIERAPGKDPLANLPKWVQLVLNDFALRLDQSNKQVTVLQADKGALQARVADHVSISVQIADSIAELGRFFTKKQDDGKEVILVEPILDMTEKCLGYERALINRIFETFKNLGMVKVELDQDSGKELMTTGNLPRFKWYSDFLRSAKSGKNRKLLQSNLPFKFRKILFALRDYSQKSGGDVQKLNKVDTVTLMNDFERLTKIKPELAAFELAAEIGLLEIKKSGKQVELIFNPTQLVRTLITIIVVKRLRSDPSIEEEKDTPTSA